MTTTWLRVAAVVTAGIAVADPSCTTRRALPPNVHVRLTGPGAVDDLAADLRVRLTRARPDGVTFDPAAPPSAIVVLGERVPDDVFAAGAPVVLVSRLPAPRSGAVVSASDPRPSLVGWTARVPARVHGRAMSGKRSSVTLEHRGIPLARVEHRWTADDEVFDPGFTFLPTGPGLTELALVVRPVDGDAGEEMKTHLRVLAEARRLKVLAHDTRPSWAAAFVRRAIDGDPLFEVASIAGVSRDISVRAGQPPRRLDPAALEAFEVVVIGAPEELSTGDVAALDRFVRDRGGVVALLADRLPRGPYARLLPVAFAERLFDRPQKISSGVGSLFGSEFALPAVLPRGIEPLATLAHESSSRAAVFAWPAGSGRFIFSGVLDVWRFRGRDDGFDRFWRAHLTAAGAAVRPVLDVDVAPGIASPADRVTVTVRARMSAFDSWRRRRATPALSVEVAAPDGSRQWVRMWPLEEAGVFEGSFDAGPPGDYDVTATASDAGVRTGQTRLAVRAGADRPLAVDVDPVALVRAGGGIVTAPGDLDPLLSVLKTLQTGEQLREVRPARSWPWAGTFAGLLCTEWLLRRRAGAR
ncbi:MAG TPA: hypothetical protein VD833_12490 [Vicinamibacterales bacterium]|nr:hypothetical protein [Vicinamibacterales bacterium]